MDLINRVRKFVSHWYKRYLVSTELYMVEPWERVVIHVLLTIFFVLFWYFNYTIIVNGISKLRAPVEDLGFTSN
ncbi:serine palmitoyltransferase small subunit A [Melitaea cinxia]|uniref:serine palmitoyltransferase small subunit A n=1 Tax=Melitaea cinxia TaxID=113334 RepID=UPI0004EA4EBD|nr:serine palmitoyltransferase small subunit A [Melitaea cinxia]